MRIRRFIYSILAISNMRELKNKRELIRTKTLLFIFSSCFSLSRNNSISIYTRLVMSSCPKFHSTGFSSRQQAASVAHKKKYLCRAAALIIIMAGSRYNASELCICDISRSDTTRLISTLLWLPLPASLDQLHSFVSTHKKKGKQTQMHAQW